MEAGTQVGTVTYTLGEETLAVYPVITLESSEKIDYLFCLRRAVQEFLQGSFDMKADNT